MDTSSTGAGAPCSPVAVLRDGLNRALFDLHTPVGRHVNAWIMALVVLSVGLSMVATVESVPGRVRDAIENLERAVSVLFAVEYGLRLFCARRPARYAFSFYGLVDLLTWLPLLVGQGNVALRLLRVIRLLKLIRYMGALRLFLASMRDTLGLVGVVVGAICVLAVIGGNLAYMVEPSTFHNAFVGFWWALVTMTTVGYGDMVPGTVPGRLLAGVLMMCGITMFAVLTGTISVKVASLLSAQGVCGRCRRPVRVRYAFCPHCGASLGDRDGDGPR